MAFKAHVGAVLSSSYSTHTHTHTYAQILLCPGCAAVYCSRKPCRSCCASSCPCNISVVFPSRAGVCPICLTLLLFISIKTLSSCATTAVYIYLYIRIYNLFLSAQQIMLWSLQKQFYSRFFFPGEKKKKKKNLPCCDVTVGLSFLLKLE